MKLPSGMKYVHLIMYFLMTAWLLAGHETYTFGRLSLDEGLFVYYFFPFFERSRSKRSY